MKEVRNLKNILKKRLRSALLAVILLFTMGFTGYNSKANASTSTFVNINTPSNQTITIDKTAESIRNDLYKIKFDINGTVPQNEKVKADIIMVVDESTSMKDKIKNVRDAAENFVNTIYNSTNPLNADIRMAISTFGKREYNDDGMDFTGEKFTGTLSMGRDAVSVNGILQGKFFITVNSAEEYPVDDVRDLIEKTAIIITPLPSVEISGTNNTVLDLEVSEGATVTAKAEGTGVCTVTAEGNKLTITGVAAGHDIIELTCSAEGEASSTRTIMVTVVEA